MTTVNGAEMPGNLRSQLNQPGDSDCEGACKDFNAMIDRRPRLILRAAAAADLIA